AGSADEVAVKNLSRWSNTDYINIWIVNKINGSATAPGGYTYFPEYNSANTDGLVLNASVVNGTNKTIVHEMGHFFSLYHPFHDNDSETTCADNTDCTQDGDKVCDTEPELNVPCGTSTNSCNGNQPFIIADADKNYTVLNNFMGYTNCQWMFTEGQKTRARSALLNFRDGLITSKALTAPDGNLPVAACIPTATFSLSPYYGIQKVEFNTLSVYSNTSLGDGSFYVDRTCNQSTTVIQGSKYTLTITGSYGNPHRIKAYIDYNNDGDFNDVNETLFSAYTDTAKKKITIPLSGVVTGVPLRMRVVADNPTLPAPSACKLHGDSSAGAGQIEDYTVIIMPATFAKLQPEKPLKLYPAIIAEQ
ncbi:MAG: M43 family zinc metalloprotease, partial [Parafilimonas sp.]